MILFKNEPNTKLNHKILVQASLCMRTKITHETENINKNSLFCSIFEILLTFRPLELRKNLLIDIDNIQNTTYLH